MPTKKICSIVIPCYNEEDNVMQLYSELKKLSIPEHISLKLLYVDDNSEDDTWPRICELSRADSSVSGIKLTRNYGHQAALQAGLREAGGDAVITMDADLQHPPSCIPRMIECWEDGANVVNMIRKPDPTLPVFKRVSSSLFYKTFRFLTRLSLNDGQSDFRLFDSFALSGILQFQEKCIFLRGIVCLLGTKQESLEFIPAARQYGETKYTLPKMLRLALNASISFSAFPLRLGFFIGIICISFAFIYVIYAFGIRIIIYPENIQHGWASLVVLISFLFGSQFLYMSIMGEYIIRIFNECKNRPTYIVEGKTSSVGKS